MTYHLPPGAPPPPARKGLSRMTPGQRAGLFVGGPVLLFLLCCGGIAALGGDPDTADRDKTSNGALQRQQPQAQTAVTTAAPTPSRTPSVEKKQVTEAQEIAFQIVRQNDSTLAKGTERIRTAGVPGEKTLTYEVTYTDGVETARTLLSEAVTRQPVNQVVLVGTKAAAAAPAPPKKQCHASYTGKCVPIASDVDCAGGGGNGPAYVTGPVNVVGPDVYDLDRDGNGIGCE